MRAGRPKEIREDREVPFIVHWVPGERALITVVNYHRGRCRRRIRLWPDRLGFAGAVKIRDYETFRGLFRSLKPKEGADPTCLEGRLRLGSHAVRMYEVLPVEE